MFTAERDIEAKQAAETVRLIRKCEQEIGVARRDAARRDVGEELLLVAMKGFGTLVGSAYKAVTKDRPTTKDRPRRITLKI